MEAWGWILVYLVGFTLFQLLLFRYFTDDRAFERISLGSEQSAPQSVDSRSQASDGRHADEETEDGDGIRCRHCGTYNADEPTVRYCRECLGQLR